MASPQVLVIGGPNGAGKSTFAEGVLPATIPIAEKAARRAVRVYHPTQWRLLNEEANREEKTSSDNE